MRRADAESFSFLVRAAILAAGYFVLLGVAGCGKGVSVNSDVNGGGTSGADFTLTLATTNLSITGGATATLMASVAGQSGFNSPVTLQIAGLPAGVTYSPSVPVVNPGSSVQISLAAAATVSSSTAAVTVTGTSGSLRHSVVLSLTVQAAVQSVAFRTRYVRTDAVTEYGYELNSKWMVYNSTTNRFFVSDPEGSRVFVLDAATQKQIGAIVVPGAFGIDEAPDHSIIYVATQIGDVYTIDPLGMQVTKRYLASTIGPSGFKAYEVRALANGKLALLGGQGGIPSVDGFGSLAVWSPADNSAVLYGGQSQFCVRNIGVFTLTGDRSLIVVTSIDSDGTLCTLDPVTGKQTAVASGREFVYQVTPTPDGKSLLLPIYPSGQIAVFNAHTLAQTSTLTVSGDTSSAASMIVSPDSSTLYLSGSGILYAYDLTSGAAVGWMSSLDVQPVSGGMAVGPVNSPNLQAFDGTGLLAGPMEEGVGFLDTKTLRTGPVGAIFTNSYLTPATGPESGGTPVQFNNVSGTKDLTGVYFDATAASGTSAGTTFFFATTPPGVPGAADVYATLADGSMLMIPEGFSYGPTILEVTPGSATAEGGGTGYIFGYGFGSTANNAPIPAGLQVTVGGRLANVTAFFPNAYGLLSPPFNLQRLNYTIPAGVTGTSADVAVITQSGTATKPGGLQYLPAVQQIPLPGSALAQGVYDAKRDLYYFTDTAQIRVYSRTEGQWLNSIQVPAASPGVTHRLWGIALSADGSKLAVSDASAQLIYLIDPDLPATVRSFPVLTYFAGFPLHQNGVITNPAGLAVSNSGSIYYAAFTTGGDGYDGFFKLDTTTGKVTDYKMDAFGVAQYKVAVSGDQTKAYFNNDGAVFTVATATDQVTYATAGPGCCYGDYDLAVAANGNTVEATGYLYDANLNATAYPVLNDRESLVAQYVYGTKLSPDAGLLFQPGVSGIDVFDARLGTVRAQISLPIALSQNYDALVSDGKDNVLVAITGQTGNGIAIVDLSSSPRLYRIWVALREYPFGT